MRFVEVCIGTGKPYSSFLNQKKNNRNFTPILIGLEAERSVIYNRINQRVDIMMNEGLLAEAEKLYQNKTLNALQTVGYRELFSYFDSDFSLPFAIEEIKKNTRRFSKRQLTWFKRTENTKWFDYLEDRNKIIKYIIEKIHNS
jgi:tRNA dimethylallyltransferase